MAGMFEIALAAGLLSGRGNLGGIMGRSLMDAQRAYLATSEDKRRNKLSELQAQQAQMELDKHKAMERLAQLPSQFYTPPTPAGVDATGGMDTDPRAANNMIPGRLDLQGLSQKMLSMPYGLESGLKLQDMLKKQGPTYHNIAAGGRLIATDPTSGRVTGEFTNPKEEDPSPVVKLMKERSKFPPGSFEYNALTDAIEKAKSHPPGATMNNYGPPLPFVDPETKQTLYVQPPTRPGAPSQVVTDPRTGKPASKPNETAVKDPSEFQSKAKLYYQSMDSATQVLHRLEMSGRTDWKMTPQEAVISNEDAKTVLMSPARQKYVQAQRQWIDSINRVRSGANLPELEYHRAVRTFFPTIGEGKELIEQKRQQRAQEEAAMRDAAGRAMKDAPASTAPSGLPSMSDIDAEIARRAGKGR
jgi:hypothetical protein